MTPAVLQDEQRLFLIMDYVGGGDLYSLIERKGKLQESWVRTILVRVGNNVARAKQTQHSSCNRVNGSLM